MSREREAAKDRVWNSIKGGEWVPGFELTRPDVGGSEGLRRLRELRVELREELGGLFDIEKRKIKGSTAYEYRLVRVK